MNEFVKIAVCTIAEKHFSLYKQSVKSWRCYYYLVPFGVPSEFISEYRISAAVALSIYNYNV